MHLRTLRRLVCLVILAVAGGCTCVTEAPAKKKDPKKKMEVRKEPLRPFVAPKKSGTAVLRSPEGRKERQIYDIKKDADGTEVVQVTPERGSPWIWRFPDDGRVRTIQLLQVFGEGSLTSFDFEVETHVGTLKPCLRTTINHDKMSLAKSHFYYCENVGLARIERYNGVKPRVWMLEKLP